MEIVRSRRYFKEALRLLLSRKIRKELLVSSMNIKVYPSDSGSSASENFDDDEEVADTVRSNHNSLIESVKQSDSGFSCFREQETVI